MINAISHERALSFFPQATIRRHQNILVNEKPQNLYGDSLDRLETWGYESLNAPDPHMILQPESEFYVAVSARFPGDEYCLTIKIPYFGLHVPRPDYLQSNSFTIRYYRQHNKIFFVSQYFRGVALPYIFQKGEAAMINNELKHYLDRLNAGDLLYVFISFGNHFYF
jgi:hypothetical protein